MRTDYSLQSFASNSNKISWSLSLAEMEVSLLGDEDNGHSGSISSVDSRYRLGWECGDPFTMRLSCSCPLIVTHVGTCHMYDTFSRPSQPEIGGSFSFEPKNVRLPSSGLMLHQQLKMDIVLRLQNEIAFDVILSQPAPETHNSGVVCWVNHPDFSGDISYIFFELSEASYIILLIFLIIRWFVHYSVQVPNEKLKLLGDSNWKKPSKRKRRCKSRKSKSSLDSKDKRTSSGNKMKETHESRNSGGCLVHRQLKMDSTLRLQNEDAFDVILSLPSPEINNSGDVCWVNHTNFYGDISYIFLELSEASSIKLMIFFIIGWFVRYSIQVPNEQLKLLGDTNLKKPSKRKRRRKTKKSKANLNSEDKHASSRNEGKHGIVRSDNESDHKLATPSKMIETRESRNGGGGLVHQPLKTDIVLRLQNENGFDVILSQPAPEINNSGVVCWLNHKDFSGEVSCIFLELSEASSIELMIFFIVGWFVRYSIQVPNEQLKLLGDSNLKKPSKRKRRRKSKKSKENLDSEDKHASSGNEGKHGIVRSDHESNHNLATSSRMKETRESRSSGGDLVHQPLKTDIVLRLQNENAFDVILSQPSPEIHNSGVVCWVNHPDFSGDISCIFLELSEASSIKLMNFFIIGWFVRYSIQVPNEQLKLLGDSNLKKPSKRKRRRKSKKSKANLDSEDKHALLGNEVKHGIIRSDNESNHNLAMPSKMKETWESRNSSGDLVHQPLKTDIALRLQNENAFDVILSQPSPEIHNWVNHSDFSGDISCIFLELSEASSIELMIFFIIGWFVRYSIQVPNEQLKLLGDSNLKKPSKRKRRSKSKKSKANLDSEDKHASSWNEGKHGIVRSDNESNHNLAVPSKMKETWESRNSGGDLVHQPLKTDIVLRLQNENGFGVILSQPSPEIHNSGVVYWVNHTDFSGDVSCIFLELSEASSIKLMIFFIIGWFVRYSIQVPNEQLKLLGDSNLKKPSKRKRRRKSKKSKANLDSEDKHASLGNDGNHGNIRSNNESNHNLATPSKMKETHESRNSDGGLDRKDEHVYTENERRLSNIRSDDEVDPNLKTLSKRKKQEKSRKKNTKKDELVSSENDGRSGHSRSSRSNDEGDSSLKTPSKTKKTHKSRESNGGLDKKDEHVSLEKDGKFGKNRSSDGDDCSLKMPSEMKNTLRSGENDGGLNKNDETACLENEGSLVNSMSNEGDSKMKTLSRKDESHDNKGEHFSSENDGRLGNRSDDESDINLKMPSKKKKMHKSKENDESLDKKDEHVSLENEGKPGYNQSDDGADSHLKTPCKLMKTHNSGQNRGDLGKEDKQVSSENEGRLGDRVGNHEGLDKKDEHVYLENEERPGNHRSNNEGDPDLKRLSKRKKRSKSRKINGSVDNRDDCVSPENNGKLGNTRSDDEVDPNLKMPAKLRKTHKSLESDGSLDKKDEHVSSEVEGKLGSNRINDEGHSKMKMPTWIKKTLESRCQKDEYDSSENGDRLGNSRSGDEGDSNLKTLSKSNRSLDRKEEHVSLENEGRLGKSRGNDCRWMNLKKLVGGGTPECWIGKLFVLNSEIAKGINRTILLEGFYEGRSDMLKCLVRGHDYAASLEIQSLTASDRDSNMARLYGAEYAQDFTYLALEFCAGSFDDLIRPRSNSSEKSVFPDDPASNSIMEYKMQSDLVKGTMQDLNLWRTDGRPSLFLLKLRDVVSGLFHLHHLGILHQDLKPQNVLITQELCANLSDMGRSKLLLRDTSSSEYHVADCGNSGMQAPEQHCHAHQTCSDGVFGLNRVSFFCVTGRRHPFGDSLKGDSNIKEKTMDLSSVEFMPEAADLFACLLHPDPNMRPKELDHVYLEDEGTLGNCGSYDEHGPNLKALSKRKKQGKSRKINQSLDIKDEHGSLENDDRVCESRSYDEGDPNLKMPSKMKKTHESIESDGNLNKKDKHVSSEMDGKLSSNRIDDEGESKMKVPCWIKQTHESGKRNENLDNKDEHVSSENEHRLGNSRSGDTGDFNSKTLSNWKKGRKSGKRNAGLDRKEEHVFSENEDRLGDSVGNHDPWMNLKKPVGGGTPGCWIGKLFVSNTEIAKGSKGTIILEGSYEGRPVAVKRLGRAHHCVASQEIQSLIASDQDPNVVRFYGTENDQDFMYLALEWCACSLDDLIRAHSNSTEKFIFPDDPGSNATIEYKMQLDSVKGTMRDVNLWREDGHPSPLLVKLMRDVVSGLVHLHRLGIIHQDLKPQSVMITKTLKELCAKLSDLGSSKLIPGDTSSSGSYATDCGSLGGQAPVQLCPAHQSCLDDVFDLGRILFFCVTGGRHPSGDSLKGDSNIKKDKIDLSPVEFLPEAADLLAHLLNPSPNLRPQALEVLHHPLFWNSKTRLSFLQEVSDWVERARGAKSDIRKKLESIAQHVFDKEWNEKIDDEVIKHQRKFRAYKFKKVRDLLRFVRNVFSHYRGFPQKIQEIVGSSPEDLDTYFAKRFPRLLIETYRFISMRCKDEEPSLFLEYFNW